ncbi:cytochrome d ubiquinol oxidase subunit II [Orrella daihaiensis]|uniref:Cytochrome d ubiquinol oxidase subunit II n=1 Tax=Orrella daihaiensis TaxID=2782176 RepID=A0ABY4AQL8_9BURK|nr:cytochrome d ubiquinol oxidase subunit II [Orrella daihaiensis]UOD51322.1 cytochrome d ubiquinol oxidase subunit II [Orrella daihaiensis]
MIDSLSASMGLAATDPVFWMPLALMLLVTVLLLGLLLLDGIALGTGLLLPWVSAERRALLLDLIAPWQAANERWLPIMLGVSIAGFPIAWSVMIEGLYVPFLMLVCGALLRSIAMRLARHVWLYGLGSLLGALGFGLVLAAYVTGQRFHWSFVAFDLVVSLAMVAAFALLAASWLVIKLQGELANRLAKLAAAAARWTAAGMVALSFMLALANPAIFYKWTHGNNLEMAGVWWLVMLVAFVWLDRLLRSWEHHHAQSLRVPVFLSWLLLALMFAGVVYSIFPFLVLDELTLWDAAAPVAPLSLVALAAGVIAVVGLAAQVWDYRRLLAVESGTQRQ